MTTTEDKPVDREAWKRLLDGEGEGPPALTDARIRAKARQALTPRTARWWLPASLAASLLLAVVLVQRQNEGPGAPAVVSESDYVVPPAPSAAAPPVADESQLDAVAPARVEPRRDDALRQQVPQSQYLPVDADAERAAAKEGAVIEQGLHGYMTAPVAPPPQVARPATGDTRSANAAPAEAPAADSSAVVAAAAESKREENLGEIVVSGNRRRQDDLDSTTPVTQVTAADVSNRSTAHTGALMKSGEAVRTPEAWYAEIEKLRAAGKKREAKRELKKLEEAHPGWLEKNHPTER